MFDMTGIGAALTSAKVILELAKNANDAQLAMKISGEVANLQGRLIDVQQQALVLQAENQDLRDQLAKNKSSVEELRGELKHKQGMKFSHGAYWTKDAGPFCQHCWEYDGKTIHLSRVAPGYGEALITEPAAIVSYTCAFHSDIKVALPVSPAGFRSKLMEESS